MTLAVESATTTATTDADGRFVVEMAAPGDGRLVAEAAGFAPLRRGVRVAPGLTLDLVLRPPAFADEVTVTAARTAAPRGDSPASLVVVSGEELRASAAATLDDALRQVPGFSLFRRSGSRTANPTTQGAFLRGVGASGASRALVLDDGIPLNDAFGGWVQWGRVPRASVGRVEVLSGGASDIHGSGALAGVVHVVRQPVERPTLLVDSSYGAQGTSQLSLLAGTRGRRWAGSIAAESFRTDGYVLVERAARGPVDTRAGTRHTTVDLTLEHAPGPGSRAFLRGSLFDEARRNGTPLQTNDTNLWQARFGADERLGGGLLSVRAHTGHQDYEQTFSAVAAGRRSETLTRAQRVPSDVAGASAHWMRALGQGGALAAGFEARAVRGASEEDVFTRPGAPPVPARSGGEQRDLGVFAEALASPHRRFVLSLGLRLDRWRNRREGAAAAGDAPATRTEEALSPRLTLRWRLAEPIQVTAAAYRAFRAPTLNELYRSFRVGNVFTLANDALSAERLEGVEAGLRLGGRGASVRATLFSMETKRTVANVTLSATPELITRQRQNLGRSRSRGLELDAAWQPAAGSSLSVGYLLAAATVESFPAEPALVGLRIPQVPRHQLSLQARQGGPAGLVAVQARWSDVQYEDDRNQLALRSYWALDALAARGLGRHLELFAAGENLLGRRWDVGRTPVRTVGPPRSWRAGLRVRVGVPR